ALIADLSDKSYAKRERATVDLIAQGTKVTALLRKAGKTTDLELAKRVEMCLKQIAHKETRDKLPLSAPALLVVRKPAGAAEALLGYLPFTEDRSMKAEVVQATKRLVLAEGQAEAAVLKALEDPLAERQLAAAEILIATGGTKHWPAIRK